MLPFDHLGSPQQVIQRMPLNVSNFIFLISSLNSYRPIFAARIHSENVVKSLEFYQAGSSFATIAHSASFNGSGVEINQRNTLISNTFLICLSMALIKQI